MFLSVGARIGYFQGDVRKLVDDIGALKPTLFIGVPRVFDRVYSGVYEKVRRWRLHTSEAAGGLSEGISHKSRMGGSRGTELQIKA